MATWRVVCPNGHASMWRDGASAALLGSTIRCNACGSEFRVTTDNATPNTPGTPRRTIRVPDDLWHTAQAKAEERDEDLSAVIRAALERYVKRK